MNWPLVILVNVMMTGMLYRSITSAVSLGQVDDLTWSIGYASALLILDMVVIQQWWLSRNSKAKTTQPEPSDRSDAVSVDKN